MPTNSEPTEPLGYSAPEGFHDDEVMALALLNRILNVKPIEYGGVM